jgi:recombination protein RecT
MSTQDAVKDQLRQGAALAREPEGGAEGRKTIRQLLEDPKQQAEIARALPNALTPDRFARLLMTAINSSPNLLRCDSYSLLAAGMQCAALGLEPNTPLQHAWMLPFENRREGRFEVQVVLGYQGMIELALRHQRVQSVAAREVREHDHFRFDYGVADVLEHHYEPGVDRGDIKTYYGLSHFSGGGHYWRIIEQSEIDAHRQRSASPNSPAWKNDELAMSLKTCVRIIWPFIPKTAEAALAAVMDEQVARYDQWFNPDGSAIDVDAREAAVAAEAEVNLQEQRCAECGEVDGGHTAECSHAEF